MKLMKSFIYSYLRVLIFYIILMYLVTAPSTGTFVFRWNILNIIFTLSYLFFYPLLNYRLTNLKKVHFSLNSPSTREFKQEIQENEKASYGHRSSIGSIVYRDRALLESEASDELMSGELSFFLQGLILIISGPILILLGFYSIIERWR